MESSTYRNTREYTVKCELYKNLVWLAYMPEKQFGNKKNWWEMRKRVCPEKMHIHVVINLSLLIFLDDFTSCIQCHAHMVSRHWMPLQMIGLPGCCPQQKCKSLPEWNFSGLIIMVASEHTQNCNWCGAECDQHKRPALKQCFLDLWPMMFFPNTSGRRGGAFLCLLPWLFSVVSWQIIPSLFSSSD